MKKKPRRPTATLREGMIPFVRLSLWVMIQNKFHSKALEIKPRIVIWSFHSGNNVSDISVDLGIAVSITTKSSSFPKTENFR
ncbi:unnamed protein product [Arabidopsis thaliana]|uniref:Uncharacterized protein n=1 Tax=Arabidopsis thaliana TaxID=3702 RepID=A0A5S9XG67_ARATH|nr:unnamed protein product [Arabidopsis thaliana]